MVFKISGPIAPGDVGHICERLLASLDGGTAEIVVDVSDIGRPDLVAIDTLARLQLLVRATGGRLAIRSASAELLELLALTGLKEVVKPQPD